MARKHCDKGECVRFDLEHALRKILEHAIDGQNGSATYAMDRLLQIQKVAEVKLRSLD